ncbi:programmed cell death protein 2 isoform X2 [Cephus cinctus]|nr:programmed cell death protein 2 isoform X2 [Cephus cinctus]
MGNVDIGFVEECEHWRLESRFFPSKIGGKPAWLDLKNIPAKTNLECEYCSQPCIFLCQVYAPYEEDVRAFHRTLYVFVCKSAECCKMNKNGNLKILRSQLERNNAFYPSDPPEEHEDWRPDINAAKWRKTCVICGIFASSHCAKCKKVNYCCREHQILDWKHGHKDTCGTSQNAGATSILFPEFELATECEEVSEENSKDDEDDKEAQEIEKYKKLLEEGKAGTLQSEKDVDADLLKMASSIEDETFTNFSIRIKKYPDQVLRYDRGGKPLYISSSNQPTNIPVCQECGSKRQFEFQIMPQLLNYLKLDNTLKDLDWGILAVFTCTESCIPKSGYVTEYIWKQDINQDDYKLLQTKTTD